MADLIKPPDGNQNLPTSAHGTSSPLDFPVTERSTLRFYWEATIKHRRLVFGIVLLVLVLVAVETLTTTRLYQGTARIEIKSGSTNVLPYQQVYEAGVDPRSIESDLRTQYSILQSRTIARGVISRLNLEPKSLPAERSGIILNTIDRTMTAARRAFRRLIDDRKAGGSGGADARTEELIDRLLAGISITQVFDSRLMDISYSSPSPRLAAAVADAWAEEFIDQDFQSKLKTTELATNFLRKELKELRVRLEQSERDLNEYARAKGIFTIEGSPNDVSQKLTELNTELTKAQASLAAEEAEYENIKGSKPESFPTSLRSAVLENLETRLSILRQKQANLAAKFGGEWPEVVQTDQEIRQVEDELRRERERALVDARLRYNASLSQFNRLSGLMSRQRQLAYRLNTDLVDFNTLKREADTNRELYEGLLARLKQAGVEAGLRDNDIRIIDRSRIPGDTYWPRRSVNLALALFVGLLLGLGVAATLHILDNRIHTPEDLTPLNFPSLGIVPLADELENESGPGLLSMPDRPRLPVTSKAGESDDVAPTNRGAGSFDTPAWEAYRRLRTCLLLSSPDNPPRRILVASSLPGEGKSTTAAHAGIVFAETGSRTLLIDLDLRKGGLSQLFNVNGELGMSVFLSGHRDLDREIRPTGIANLSILPAGLRPPNPAALLASKRLSTAIDVLSKQFEFIVIDTGPVLCYTDALIISKIVDGVVLVARAEQTPIKTLSTVGRQLVSVGATVFGVVINGVDVNETIYAPYYGVYSDGKPSWREAAMDWGNWAMAGSLQAWNKWHKSWQARETSSFLNSVLNRRVNTKRRSRPRSQPGSGPGPVLKRRDREGP